MRTCNEMKGGTKVEHKEMLSAQRSAVQEAAIFGGLIPELVISSEGRLSAFKRQLVSFASNEIFFQQAHILLDFDEKGFIFYVFFF